MKINGIADGMRILVGPDAKRGDAAVRLVDEAQLRPSQSHLALDRNGLELAVDIRVPSLFAEPRRIIDVEEAAQAIHSVLPDINIDWLRQRLTGDKGFVWVKRELTPAIQEKIMQLATRRETTAAAAATA